MDIDRIKKIKSSKQFEHCVKSGFLSDESAFLPYTFRKNVFKVNTSGYAILTAVK